MNPNPALEVYDPPMCCSSGVCGPDVDPTLAAFSGFLAQMQSHGISVKRFNLAQEPLAFVRNAEVKTFLDTDGADGLPLIFLFGKKALSGRYPTSEERVAWANELLQGVNS
jgi:hypothetical protein